ncbi:MAG TPA: flagellar hook-length control protein FliK [Solirubrobacterales bacterium]|nr:flagellar hook-length control protein FliK [Solirubrobacterales bacterium]
MGEPLVRLHDPAVPDAAPGLEAAAQLDAAVAPSSAAVSEAVAGATESPATASGPAPLATPDPAVPFGPHASETNHAIAAPDPVVPFGPDAAERNHGIGGAVVDPEGSTEDAVGPAMREEVRSQPGGAPSAVAAARTLADAPLAAPGAIQVPIPLAASGAAPSAGGVAPGPSAPPPSPAAALEATIRLGAEQGFSRARLTLRPPELGAVDVVLKAVGGGVSATVLAHTPEAARLLEASGSELRARLEAQGVQLQALTVAVAGDAAAGAGREAPGEASASRGADTSAAANQSPEPLPTTTRQIELGGGVLVDVLA